MSAEVPAGTINFYAQFRIPFVAGTRMFPHTAGKTIRNFYRIIFSPLLPGSIRRISIFPAFFLLNTPPEESSTMYSALQNSARLFSCRDDAPAEYPIRHYEFNNPVQGRISDGCTS